MSQYVIPQSHTARLAFLTRAAKTGQSDIDAGRNLVSQATVDTIVSLLPAYRTAVNAIIPASSGRSKEIRERNEAIAEVQVHTRDFWEVLKRRVVRRKEDAEVLMLYGLPLDGTVPRPATADLWLEAAGRCVQGDADAVAAGHPAMANPSAAELAAVIAIAVTESSEVSDADRLHDEALAAAIALLPAIDQVIEDVMAELRFYTRKMDYPSQRRIQRTYGARFRSLPGEPSEGDRSESIATADGMNRTFEATLAHTPVVAGSVSVTDGFETLTDTDNGDGIGQLTGSAGGNGRVNYATGVIVVNFMMNPAMGSSIVVDYVSGV